jgi:hypothetical protein
MVEQAKLLKKVWYIISLRSFNNISSVLNMACTFETLCALQITQRTSIVFPNELLHPV